MKLRRKVFAYPYIVWMAIFIFAPMLLIAYYAFMTDGAVSFDNFVRVLRGDTFVTVLLRSLWVAFKTTVICLALGYPIAYILTTLKKSTASLLYVLFVVPMWMNFLLRTYAWKVLLDSSGVINTFLGWLNLPAQNMLFTESAVMIGSVYNFLPFMILPIYTVLLKIDKSHIEAAHDLGANGFVTFFKVVLPLSVPGVISGITMVFIPAITTFAITKLLGGGMFRLYGELVESMFIEGGDWGGGSALSFILLVLVVISMLIMRRFERDSTEEGGRLW